MSRWIAIVCAASLLGCDAACDAVVPNAVATVRRPRGRRAPPAKASNDLPNLFAIDLPGGATDRVEIPDHDDLEPSGAWGLALRVKVRAQQSSDIYVSKWRETTDRAFVLDLETVTNGYGRLRAFHCFNSACSGGSFSALSAYGPFETDVWTTVGASFDYAASTARIFADGAEVRLTGSGSFPSGWVPTAADWAIGARDDGNSTREIDAVVDDFVLFTSGAPSPECMFDFHNKRGSRTIPNTCPPAAVWLRGGDDDNGAGTTVTDHSLNGHDGTLFSAASFTSDVPTKLVKTSATSANRTRQVFIFLGQSNMSGRGAIGDLGASQDDEFPNRGSVYIYDNNGPIGTPNGVTNPAAEPVDDNTGQTAVFPTSEDSGPGVGPMLAAANYIAGVWTSHEVGIIPCPQGGTEDIDWMPAFGQLGRLWGECQSRWQAAAIGSATAEIAGIVVYQGESDAQSDDEPELWAYRWQAVIEAIRDDLDDRATPVVFVVLPVTAPSAGDYAQWDTVRAQQLTVCKYLDHCSTVQAPDGPWIDANLHLATAPQLANGINIGVALLATEKAAKVTP